MVTTFIEHLLLSWFRHSHCYLVVEDTELLAWSLHLLTFPRRGPRTLEICTHLHAGVAHSVTLPAFQRDLFLHCSMPSWSRRRPVGHLPVLLTVELGLGLCVLCQRTNLNEGVDRRPEILQDPLLHSVSMTTTHMGQLQLKEMCA